MQHYVTTGGAGFIGLNLADFYLSTANRVTISLTEWIKNEPQKLILPVVLGEGF